MAFVTLKDVAQRAGVSAAAVSQILHNKGRFSSDTRQLVLKTVEEMGYVPDQRARSMRSSDTKTVGLLVPDLRNPYFADLVSSMEDELCPGLFHADWYFSRNSGTPGCVY